MQIIIHILDPESHELLQDFRVKTDEFNDTQEFADDVRDIIELELETFENDPSE